jgi:hypothetical protein
MLLDKKTNAELRQRREELNNEARNQEKTSRNGVNSNYPPHTGIDRGLSQQSILIE